MYLKQTICALTTIVLAACATNTNYHGKFIEAKDLDKIKVNTHNKQDVFRIIGSPTFESKTKYNKWFYLYKKNLAHLIKQDKVLAKQTVCITFNDQDKVISINKAVALNAKDIIPTTQKTKTINSHKSIVKQALGNFGRFAGKNPK